MRVDGHEICVVAPGKESFVDLTDELTRAIKDSGVTTGICVATCLHTTCGLVINEAEDGAFEDVLLRLRTLVPTDGYYAHDDLSRRTQNLQEGPEPPNGRAHVVQMILGGNSLTIPVAEGEPVLGTWQRLLLLELDDPKPRRVFFQTLGT
jgi:secondary thiamine-phosphate synthase enzyme